MRKVIAILTVLVFAFSLLPVEVMAQDAGRAQRIKAKIREHQEGIKRLKGELRQVIDNRPDSEDAQEESGTVVEPAQRETEELSPKERGAIRKQKRLEKKDRREKPRKKKIKKKKAQKEKKRRDAKVKVKKAPFKRGGGRGGKR